MFLFWRAWHHLNGFISGICNALICGLGYFFAGLSVHRELLDDKGKKH
jgi:hypothetical protein